MDNRRKPLWEWPERQGGYSLMGVLNVTPDSFYDGGSYYQKTEEPIRSQDSWIQCAVDQGIAMVNAGARYIDIGGESSRPGADPVSVDEEIHRVIPVIQELIAHSPNIILSVDTVKPEVARRALQCGVKIVNDISGLRNPDMLDVVAEYQAGVVIMHMRGNPKTMQQGDLSTHDVVEDVYQMLSEAVELALDTGITDQQIALDVGIGFGKTLEQNILLIQNLNHFSNLGYPLLIGASRKSMIGALTGAPTEQRLPGSLAVMIEARHRGASIFRVHDVAESNQALKVSEAIRISEHRQQFKADLPKQGGFPCL